MKDEQSLHRQEAMDPDDTQFVVEEGVIEPNYRLGLLTLNVGEEEKSLHVIPIAKFNGKNLVALPTSVWHRKTAKRILPAGSLSKPTAIEACAVLAEDMEQPLEDV